MNSVKQVVRKVFSDSYDFVLENNGLICKVPHPKTGWNYLEVYKKENHYVVITRNDRILSGDLKEALTNIKFPSGISISEGIVLYNKGKNEQ